jgi:hypothetical protein
MGDITSANAVFTLQQAILFPAPVQLQGFAADDMWDTDAVRAAETSMGVDGVLSGGFVFSEIQQNISLQADSLSNDVFDIIYTQGVAAKTAYPLNGLIVFPSIGRKYTLTGGFLTSYKPGPDAKRTAQARRYQITWARFLPAPI